MTLAGVLVLGPWNAPRAEADVVPRPCATHPVHVVNPGCVPALVEKADELGDELVPHDIAYPDLQPNVTQAFILRPSVYNPETGEFSEGPPEIWFDTLSMNVGTAAVDLQADDPTAQGGSTVSQCVSWTAEFVCRDRRPVGGFSWHAAHRHYHYDDFAAYSFRRLAADRSVDYSPAGLIATSGKVSFCLVDGLRVRDHARLAPRYVSCTQVNQGISPGWADLYTADLEGQQMELGDIADGRYALVVDIDPADHLYETDNVHNRVEILVDISNDAHRVEIVDRRWP